MFAEQINNACLRFPANNQERFLLYPALAIYSPIENLVRTVVGVIFTALSVLSLGLCEPINNLANWTRYSRGILTIPLQIIGNIFELHSKILTDYNITSPGLCALGNGILPVFCNNPKISENELLEKVKDRFEKNDIEVLADIKLRKAQNICTKLFQTRTETKIQLLAKHIIFRVCSVLSGLGGVGIVATQPIISLIFLPFALYNRGKDEKLNDFVFWFPKTTQHIHTVCLILRTVVNPFQFVNETSKDLEIDKSPIINAIAAPGDFWKS